MTTLTPEHQKSGLPALALAAVATVAIDLLCDYMADPNVPLHKRLAMYFKVSDLV